MKRISVFLAVLMLCFTLFTACGKNGDVGVNIYIPIRQGNTVNYNTAYPYKGTILEQVVLDASYTTPYYTDVAFTMTGGTLEQFDLHNDMTVKEGDIIATLSSEELDEEITVQEIKLNSAKNTYEILLESGTDEEIEFAKIDLDIEQAKYDDLIARKDFLVLRAPYDGKITYVANYRPGAYVQQNATICTIEDSTRVRLSASDYNGSLQNIGFGAKVNISQGAIASTTGQVVDVVTDQIFGFGNNGGRTITNYIIKPDDETVEFESFGTIQVTFTTLRRDDALIVPSNAVFEFGDGYAVNILIDGVKIQMPVTIGIVSGDKTEILSGLDGSETLIL